MFTLLSRSNTLKRLASSYGMATPRSFARRFIAGEHVEDVIAAARALQAKGLLLTLDYLGESVITMEQATAATREYTHLMDDIVAADIERNVSVKLTQLGLAIDRATVIRETGRSGHRRSTRWLYQRDRQVL